MGGGTVSTIAIKPALDQLAKRGIDAAPVLAAAGISREVAAAIDARHPFENAAALWEHAARALDDPWFGLHAAMDLPDGWGVVDYVFCTSETLLVGYQRVCHYGAIVYDGSSSEVLDETDQYRLTRRASVHGVHYDLFLASFLVLRARLATGVQWSPRAVKLAIAAPPGADQLAATFGCAIDYETPVLEIAFDHALGAHPLLQANTGLNRVLRAYADELLARLPSRGTTIDRAHAAMVREMPHRLPSIASVATAMKMSVRSLQRRFTDAGTTFNDQLDELRRELALRYLQHASLSIGEIAFLLHFSEVSGFTRAFVRWMNETPSQYRERLWPSH